jgi:hypothetical protein
VSNNGGLGGTRHDGLPGRSLDGRAGLLSLAVGPAPPRPLARVRRPNPWHPARAAAGEAVALPPRPDQRPVDPLRISVPFELEVDPFHRQAAAGMRAGDVVVMDVGRGHRAESSLAIESIVFFVIDGRGFASTGHDRLLRADAAPHQ